MLFYTLFPKCVCISINIVHIIWNAPPVINEVNQIFMLNIMYIHSDHDMHITIQFNMQILHETYTYVAYAIHINTYPIPTD